MELQHRKAEWTQPSKTLGIEIDLTKQASALRELVKPCEPEYRGNTFYRRAADEATGPGFGYIWSQAWSSIFTTLTFVTIIPPRRHPLFSSGKRMRFFMRSSLTIDDSNFYFSSVTCITNVQRYSPKYYQNMCVSAS